MQRRISLDSYIFIVLPVLILLGGLWRAQSNLLSSAAGGLSFLQNWVGGPIFAATFGIIVGAYLLVRIWATIIFALQKRTTFLGLRALALEDWKNIGGSALYWTAACALAGMAAAMILQVTQHVTSQQVWIASQRLQTWDPLVFGVDAVLWLNHYNLWSFADQLLVMVYDYLGTVCVLAVGVFLVLNPLVLRRYLAAFFLVQIIAAPFWWAVPAISPDELYRQQVLKADAQNAITIEAPLLKLSPALATYLPYLEGRWSHPEQGRYATSTFPSLHVAWALIVMVCFYQLYRRSAIIFVPWFVLLSLSTVYTLQHFAVDVLAGALVGSLTLVLVDKLYQVEQRRTNKPPSLFLFTQISSDLSSVGRWITGRA